MKPSKPARIHFTIFVILSVVALTQLSWWVIFQVMEGKRIRDLQIQIWDRQIEMSMTKLKAEKLAHFELEQWMAIHFPDLKLIDDSYNIEVTLEARERLDEVAGKRVRMFISEGAFFSLMVFTGIWFLYWTLRKRVELEATTASVINAASSGMKNPIQSLEKDITGLSESGSAISEHKEILARMTANLKRISNTCENVSMIQMLSTSKRKISLEITDLSECTKAAVEVALKSFPGDISITETEIAPDLKAVSNPELWKRICENIIGKATACRMSKIALMRKGEKAVFSVVCSVHSSEKGDISSLCDSIESETELIRQLAETIGANMAIIADESASEISIEIETPLLEESS